MEQKLTAQDLQIGNYFYRPDCADKVVEIRKNGVIGLDLLRGLIPFSEIKGIPITPKILEKNFESEENIFGYKSYKLSTNFILEHRGHRYCLVRKCNDYTSSTFWVCDICYVHELQQAMRLCNIKGKEIKL